MSEEPVARCESGILQGVWIDGVATFRGVPYAGSAAGPGRFQPPQPVAPWSGVRPADRHGPVPPQPHSRLERVMGPFSRPQDEDCLTLTIATPAADGAKRPVVVFLHGGAYLSGAGSLDWYDGAVLAREGGVVSVGVNYRLGALGFLYCPPVAPGNLGLDDMAAALAWIERNIDAFGGDPAAVTVIGQSAGAHAIMMMLAQGTARFRRAILQSAPAALPPLTPAVAQGQGAQFLGLLGLDPAAADLEVALAAVPAERMVEAQMQLARSLARFGEITPPFLPVSEGFATPAAFLAAVARNAAALGIAMIVGTTAEEGLAFFAPDPGAAAPDAAAVAALFERNAGSADAIEAYRQARPGASDWDLVADLKSDADFTFPSLDLAAALSAAGAGCWAYRFDWFGEGSRFKACHCLELPFLFGNWPAWQQAPMLAGGDPAVMAALGDTLRAAWLAFAQTGTPSADGSAWPVYADPGRLTLCLGERVGVVGDPAGLGWKPRRTTPS